MAGRGPGLELVVAPGVAALPTEGGCCCVADTVEVCEAAVAAVVRGESDVDDSDASRAKTIGVVAL